MKWFVDGSSAGFGVNVAVRPSADTATAPGIGILVACGNTRKFAVVTVNGSTRLLNCNWITLLVGTPPAPLAGLTVVTNGVDVSAAAPVVKVKVVGFESRFSTTSVILAVAEI